MAILPGQNYYNDPKTGKSYPSGSGAYAGGDGGYVTSGSVIFNDGESLKDSGGVTRFAATTSGITVYGDGASDARLVIGANDIDMYDEANKSWVNQIERLRRDLDLHKWIKDLNKGTQKLEDLMNNEIKKYGLKKKSIKLDKFKPSDFFK